MFNFDIIFNFNKRSFYYTFFFFISVPKAKEAERVFVEHPTDVRRRVLWSDDNNCSMYVFFLSTMDLNPLLPSVPYMTRLANFFLF